MKYPHFLDFNFLVYIIVRDDNQYQYRNISFIRIKEKFVLLDVPN